jgi:hypothetical protein
MDRSDEATPVKTVFITGLPDDVTVREIYILFIRQEGYEGAVLKPMGRHVRQHQQKKIGINNNLLFSHQIGKKDS